MRNWLCAGGTMVATRDGAVPVVRLLPGAVLTALDGAPLTVASVGRTRLSLAELLARPALWPVRIAADALADGVPKADTTVLPGQPLAIPGVSPIAARWLVDGVALQCPAPTAALDIFTLALRGDGTPEGMTPAADLAASPDRAALRAMRRHIATRAGLVVGELRGSIDTIAAARLAGWADDGTGRPVALELLVDGQAQPPVLADAHRDDLAAAGIGDGRRGFMVALDPPLDPHRRHLVQVRRAQDGADLPGSPLLLDHASPEGILDLAPLLDALPPGPELRRAVEAAARMVAARIVL